MGRDAWSGSSRGSIVSGLLLWASIQVVDRHDAQNTLSAAVGWSFMLALAGVMPFFGPIVGLVVFFMECFRYDDLGLLQALGVIVVQIGIAFGLGVLLAGAAVAIAAGGAARPSAPRPGRRRPHRRPAPRPGPRAPRRAGARGASAASATRPATRGG